MPRTLSSTNASDITNTVVREHFLVYLGFAAPLRFSSRETLTFDGQSYTGAIMELNLALDGTKGQLTFVDDSYTITSKLINEGTAGLTAQVWMLYGDTWSPPSADELFNGEMGQASVRHDRVTINLVEPESKFMPDIYINEENGFNHLPPDGTEISTPNGIIVLNRRTR